MHARPTVYTMPKSRRLLPTYLHLLLSLTVIIGLFAPAMQVVAQSRPADSAAEDDLAAMVDALLARMSVADRVGQLFLIGFEGNNTGFDSDIAELIYGYRVGGVVLSPTNGNFTNERGVDTAAQVALLANRLQALAYGVLLPADYGLETVIESWPPAGAVAMERVTNVPPVNLPLLIAVDQQGDGLPTTALRRGFTPLPSALALGATWNPELTNRVGQVVGRELAAVGVNLLLGPTLDVLVQPRADAVGALGLHLFGGDPFWVAQMARAYIAGVHGGAQGRVATVARHFPGAGDADRLPDQEVATVQRTAQELQRITLPPFLAVTRNPSSVLRVDGDPAATDGLMSAHIRYTAYQGPGTGRNTPLSLSPELRNVLTNEGFGEWRGAGGILVSNVLGAPAIRRHYDAALTDFPYRRVALEAFTAGHDILYLDRFSLDDRWESEKRNIKETIGFFQDRYLRDADFAAQVDAAARRVLTLKLRLYGASADGEDAGKAAGLPVPPVSVLVPAAALAPLHGEAQTEALAVVTQVARESFTILAPDPATAADAVAPQPGDHLLIVTDSRLGRECHSCLAEAAVGPDELATIINRLYGPEGTGQLAPEQVVSLTFADLAEWLAAEAAPTPANGAQVAVEPTPSEAGGEQDAVEDPPPSKQEKTRRLVEQADWIIFAMLDVDAASAPAGSAVKQFLSRWGPQPANKRLVVLALHAPYFLDTTEISKLSVYYAVYGKTQPFLETAVRALFRSFTPTGAPPVSVPGTRFAVLGERLQPDPARPIDLLITKPSGELVAGDPAQENTGLPVVEAGAWLRIQAGPVLDRNGRPVRNGTPVELALVYEDDGSRDVETAMTMNGMAVREMAVSRSGTAHVTARAGDAVSNEVLTLSVQGPVAPQPAAPPTLVAPLPTPTSAPVAEAQPVPPAVEAQPIAPTPQPVNLASLAVTLLVMLAALSLLLVVQVRILPRATLVNNLLWAVNCGLAAYILYGLGWLPGGAWLRESLRVWGGAPVVLIAMLLPLVWLQLRTSE